MENYTEVGVVPGTLWLTYYFYLFSHHYRSEMEGGGEREVCRVFVNQPVVIKSNNIECLADWRLTADCLTDWLAESRTQNHSPRRRTFVSQPRCDLYARRLNCTCIIPARGKNTKYPRNLCRCVERCNSYSVRLLIQHDSRIPMWSEARCLSYCNPINTLLCFSCVL